MTSTKTEPTTQKPSQSAEHKFNVVVVTTGPASQPDETPGGQPVKPVIEKAFRELGITTPLEEFTFKTQAGTEISLQTKVEDACAARECRIFALPKKAQDA